MHRLKLYMIDPEIVLEQLSSIPTTGIQAILEHLQYDTNNSHHNEPVLK